MREGRYWEKLEERICRLCGSETETWEHVWEGCRRWKEAGWSWEEECRRILGDGGEGKGWMREVG